MLGFLFFFYSGSFATLSLGRSGESCLSKDQKETPLASSTKVNQTSKLGVYTGKPVGSGLFLNPVNKRIH